MCIHILCYSTDTKLYKIIIIIITTIIIPIKTKSPNSGYL